LCELLAVELAGKSADDLVFTTLTGKPLRNLNFRRDVFDQAATDAGLSGLTPHELRPPPPAASLAVSAGANVKAVQRMLGHKSAVMTLDVYAGLFDDDLDALAARMDVSDADVEQMWNSADVIELPTARNPL
jgi:integrase